MGHGTGNRLVLTTDLRVAAITTDLRFPSWNSWDRVPYITTLRNGSASIVPADRHIHHNFIIANYNSEGAIDTDDGSAYYSVHDNFFACVIVLQHRTTLGIRNAHPDEPIHPSLSLTW